MSTALAVLLFVLKCLGILLLIVLALLIIVLLTPAGVDLLWESSRYTIHARFGPVRYLLMPREKRKKKEKPEKKDAEKSKPAADEKKTDAVKPKAEAENPDKKPDEKDKEDDGLQSDIKDAIQSILKELKDDPFGTIQRLLDEYTPLGGQLMNGIHVQHLRVLWTVAGDDAAQTAIAYGRAITLSNIVLERVQELMNIQADSLRLEPDFANQMAEKRHLSCQITVRPCIIVIIGIKLLWHFLQLRKTGCKKN